MSRNTISPAQMHAHLAYMHALSRARFSKSTQNEQASNEGGGEKKPYHAINEMLLFIRCGHLYDTITSDHILLE